MATIVKQLKDKGTGLPFVPVTHWDAVSNKPTIPASQVNSDWNSSSGVSEILNKPTIPSKTSDLTNDSGFITTETDPTVPSWAKASNKPTYTASEVGALPDNTIIPSKTSDLTNDSGFLTQHLELKTINNESIAGSGNIDIPTYTLPTASDSVLGGIKVGNNLSINESGTLSVNFPSVTVDECLAILEAEEES